MTEHSYEPAFWLGRAGLTEAQSARERLIAFEVTPDVAATEELVESLARLLDTLGAVAANSSLWRDLAAGRRPVDPDDRAPLARLGSAPWAQLLTAAGYRSPPPPAATAVADQLGIDLSWALTSALEGVPDSADEYVRPDSHDLQQTRRRLRRTVDELRERTGIPKPDHRELPRAARIAIELGISVGGALLVAALTGAALPAVLAASAGAILVHESLTPVFVDYGGRLLTVGIDRAYAAVNETWQVQHQRRSAVTRDPVLALVALLIDHVAVAQRAMAKSDPQIDEAAIPRLLARVQHLAAIGQVASERWADADSAIVAALRADALTAEGRNERAGRLRDAASALTDVFAARAAEIDD